MGARRRRNIVNIYQKSDPIFKENSEGQEMYILKSGKVKLILEDPRGDVEVGTLDEPGEFFGEMALIDNAPRTATAIAEVDNTELEVLDRESFLSMISEYPEFAIKVMHELSKRVRLGNALYLEVIEGTMSPFCRRNCLKKTMDAFTRQAMAQFSQECGEEAPVTENWKCDLCDYVYVPQFGDPQGNVAPGTPFEKIPDTWTCPECTAPKSKFHKIEC